MARSDGAVDYVEPAGRDDTRNLVLDSTVLVSTYVFVCLKKIRTHLDLLSIPQSGGENVKTFRRDHRLQIQNLFMAFKRVPRW